MISNYLLDLDSATSKTSDAALLNSTFKFQTLLVALLLVCVSATSFANSPTTPENEEEASADCTPTLWYRDYDGDGFGSTTVSISACVQPVGYVANNTDCNDYNANVNPGNTEIYYNGFDDDCTNTLDDGAWIITRVQDQFDNAVLPSMGTRIDAYPVEGATAYKFEVLTTANGTIQTVITQNPYFYLTDLQFVDYGSRYRIQIMVQRHFAPTNTNVWLGYFGQPRMVHSPTLESVMILESCGEEIAASGIVGVKPIHGATQYRFKVKRHANDLYPVVFSQSEPSFNITNLYTYTYGAVHYVSVSVKLGNGAFTAYGQECPIATISPDTFSITQCGFFYGGVNMFVSAHNIPYAQEYRFRLFNPSTGVQQIIQRPVGMFYLNEITNIQVNSEYQVSVAARSGGGWSEYGPTCSFHSPPVGIIPDGYGYIRTHKKVSAAPNPFPNTFTINIEGANTGVADIKVYDMIGKLVESRMVLAIEASSIEVGANLPAGIYNVVVAQEDDLQALKVIKK